MVHWLGWRAGGGEVIDAAAVAIRTHLTAGPR